MARTLRRIAAPLFALASVLRSTGAQHLSEAMNSHAPLVRALRSRDECSIRNAVHEHLKNSYDQFLLSGAEDCRTYALTGRGNRTGAG